MMPASLLRTRLHQVLAREAPLGRKALAARLGASERTVLRMLTELGTELVSEGATRQRRFALRRPVRGVALNEPLFAIGVEGRITELGRLQTVRPEGCFCDLRGTPWPVDAESATGWWPGLPYPVLDARPQGFLGRLLARRQGEALGLDPNPEQWHDDAVLVALRHLGVDTVGNLVLGARALESAQQRWLQAPCPDHEADTALGERYASLAERAMEEGVPGSSAGGEFPKFLSARRLDGAATPHVLVKFSGPRDSGAAVRRWADLLVAEHLALDALATLPGHRCARTRLLQAGGRQFLEVERFDRHGDRGRSPLVSLASVNAALAGAPADWFSVAQALHAAGWLDPEAVQRVEEQALFSRLIANSDTHLGNLSLVPVATPSGPRFELAPAYDLLPTAYAPLAGGELPRVTFTPALPSPAQRPAWARAYPAALSFWRRAAADSRLSEGFRAVAAENAGLLVRAGAIGLG